MTQARRHIVVLYSGGLDSRILLQLAHREPDDPQVTPFFLHHGHDAGDLEQRAALGAVVRRLEWMEHQEPRSAPGNACGPILIPGRNLICAAVAACQLLPDEVWMGSLAGEVHDGNSDRSQDFMDAGAAAAARPGLGQRPRSVSR